MVRYIHFTDEKIFTPNDFGTINFNQWSEENTQQVVKSNFLQRLVWIVDNHLNCP